MSAVAQARLEDTDAFTELAERYQRNIFRLAQNITQNREDAEDALQETFLKAYQHLPEFEGHSKFYTWIVRIGVNEALMKLRKRKWDKMVWLDEPVNVGEDSVAREIAVWEDNPEQRYSQEELREILDKAVNGLAAPYRTVFALRDIEGLSTEETSEALDPSIPAVKSRLLRAPAIN
jgi:RNA polymerase sigma-70 factor (ECF subfamily)